MKTRRVDEPMTWEEYKALSPYEQGYVSYMRAEWPGWDIPKVNPYSADSAKGNSWNNGAQVAALEAADIDE